MHEFYYSSVISELVSWSLTSLFSTNMAISETSVISDSRALYALCLKTSVDRRP